MQPNCVFQSDAVGRRHIYLPAPFSYENRFVTLLLSQLAEVEQRWETVREESPNIPGKIWTRIEKTMTLEKDIAMHPSFGQIAQQGAGADGEDAAAQR